eukprot:s1_g2551.t1
MLRFDDPLVLVGAGKMGGALLMGWLDQGLDPASVFLRDPTPPAEIAQLVAEKGLRLNLPLEEMETAPRIVVLAVKPQIMDAVLPDLRPLVRPGTLFLSIAAGVDLERLDMLLGGGAAIIRAMPNTPSSVGKGITAVIGNNLVTDADRAICDGLLGTVGDVVWLSAEGQMDAVTALSGSGPAYVFALAETMTAAGEALGLEPELAAQLARMTVAGAGAMLETLPEDAATLRQNVSRAVAPRKTTEDKIIDAALQLAAEEGWAGFSLSDVAQRAKVPLVDLHGQFSGKRAILAAFSRRTDVRVLRAVDPEDQEGERPKDRLFDVLMLRFDELGGYKEGVRAISKDLSRDPLGLLAGARPALRSMHWMLEAASIDSGRARPRQNHVGTRQTPSTVGCALGR